MREILFRGKRKDNGEWVYGGILCWNGLCAIVKHIKRINGIWSSEKIEVIPETVGQFTGLKDKNGKEIYEGDILTIQLPMGGFWGNVKKEETGIVKYIADKGGYVVQFDTHKYGKNQSYVQFNCDIAFDSEIIGNIHDNPELLKQNA